MPPYAQGKIAIHPDGRQFAYDSGGWTGEVWVLENFLPALRTKKRGERAPPFPDTNGTATRHNGDSQHLRGNSLATSAMMHLSSPSPRCSRFLWDWTSTCRSRRAIRSRRKRSSSVGGCSTIAASRVIARSRARRATIRTAPSRRPAVSIGVFGRQGRRNAPALINRGYGRAFFWDGRITTLEEQVLKPIEDPNEMDLPVAEAAARVGLSGRRCRAPSPATCARSSRATRRSIASSTATARRSRPSSRPACRSSAARATAPRATWARISPTKGCTTPASPGSTAG